MIEEKVQVGEKVTGEVIEFWQKGSEITEATGEYLGKLDFLGEGYGGAHLLQDGHGKKWVCRSISRVEIA